MANKKNEKRNLVRQRKVLKAKGPLNAFVPNPLVYQRRTSNPKIVGSSPTGGDAHFAEFHHMWKRR